MPVSILLIKYFFNLNLDFLFVNNLYGYVEQLTTPNLTIKNFSSHTIQNYYESMFINNLPLRSSIIRLNNEIYYLFFKKSYSYNNQVIIGKNGQLFELGYIKAYCSNENSLYDDAFLIQWANKLALINNYFFKKGKRFIYLIAPSKAEYLHSAIPSRFCHGNESIKNERNKKFENLLNERGVNVINAPLIMQDATKKYNISMFSPGGTHWNFLAGAITSNFIIEKLNLLNSTKLNLIDFDYKLVRNPNIYDIDLLNLLNLFKKPTFFSPKLTFKPSLTPTNIKLTFIGDSFSDQPINALVKSNIFSKILLYRYFNTSKTEYIRNSEPIVEKVNIDAKDMLDPILSSDVIILEENIAALMSNPAKLFYEKLQNYI